jgi:TatD DNase family protein
VERGNYSAIGEIGMDLRKNIPHLPDADLQMKVFSEQLDIAAEMSLPLIIHCVRAHEQLLRLIKNNGFSCGGVVHGFTGSLETARQWIKSGFKLGIGPFIVNPRMTDRQRRMLGSVGIENILLETDAPNNYIDQNFAIGVPVSLHNTLETVASIYGIDVEKAADIIESNVHSLFFT